MSLMQLGSSKANIHFYLPNSPQHLPAKLIGRQSADFSNIEIEQIVSLNGNHWRKIFVIMAKIAAPNEDWRQYKPSLLTSNEQILFGAKTLIKPNHSNQRPIHLICGAQSCLTLGFAKPEARKIKLYRQQKGVVITTPYLDYRQFPNQLIEQTRAELANHKS